MNICLYKSLVVLSLKYGGSNHYKLWLLNSAIRKIKKNLVYQVNSWNIKFWINLLYVSYWGFFTVNSGSKIMWILINYFMKVTEAFSKLFSKSTTFALTGASQLVGHCPAKQKVAGSIPNQETCLDCGFRGLVPVRGT